MLDAWFSVVQDATVNPKARRKAALKIAGLLLPKVANKAKALLDEYGFSVNPNLASAYRDIQLELRALVNETTHSVPAIAERIKKLEARSDAIRRRLQVPCPTKYGHKEAAKDQIRLMAVTRLRDTKTTLTEAQMAEEAHLKARFDVFAHSPESIARRRRKELQDTERRYKASRLTRDFYAPPLSRRDRNELEFLRRLYPEQRLSELEDDEFQFYRNHPFEDELLAPDGNFYPRDSKLRPAGVADDVLVETTDGPSISPVIPCNAPATDPIPSVEPAKLR